MYTNGPITFTNPFHIEPQHYSILDRSQPLISRTISPYAAYANLNRPPTPPPEMHGGYHAIEPGHTRQERGYDSVVAEQHIYKPSQESFAYTQPQPLSPVTQDRSIVNFEVEKSSTDSSAIAPSLQIPRAVNSSGGSLSELAAEITCLFWFETFALIQQIEESTIPLIPWRALTKDAIPTTGFRKWVATILSTTQIGANVVLLALLFIHRLKKLNPTVIGKPGSEYRLLTVALMLGNKFLDDNTYTNKTWAEVSGINVNEVHVMEVEFLSNMKYCLYTTSEEWAKWQSLLGRYATYFERAQQPILVRAPQPILPPASSLRLPLALPSPPASTQASPPYTDSGSFSQGLTPAHSPLALAPVVSVNPRKRSFDDHYLEPAAKRVASMHYEMRPAMSSFAAPPQFQQLPPLAVPARAMGIAYPGNTAQPVPQLHSRQHSPYLSSPAADITTPVKLFNTSTDLSPSVFLRQRSSPYRPVHNVSTLLYPPPSAALQQRPSNIEQSQMHYQPLGKQTQLHTGRLPFVGQTNWTDAIQQSILAPVRHYPASVYQQRPHLPHP